MIHVFTLLDKSGTAELRLRVRPQHKDYLAGVAERIAFAGPLFGPDQKTMIGSLLAIDFDSADAAKAWLADEPFTMAGLYGQVSVLPFANLWPQKAGFPPA